MRAETDISKVIGNAIGNASRDQRSKWSDPSSMSRPQSRRNLISFPSVTKIRGNHRECSLDVTFGTQSV